MGMNYRFVRPIILSDYFKIGSYQMSLSFKDRFKAIVRTCRIILDPNVDYINLMWRSKSSVKPENAPVFDATQKQAIYTHTFFMEGDKPVNTMLTYMAHVAAASETLDDLNIRCEFYLSKVAVAHMLLKPNKAIELQHIKQPIRCVPTGLDKDASI